MIRIFLFMALAVAPALAAPLAPGLLGASYPDHDGFAHAAAHLDELARAGFRLVTLVPGHALVGLNRIDFSRSPAPERLEEAIRLALAKGFHVVVKPHLEPGMYKGIDPAQTPNHSWRVSCPWRGWFDLDPLCTDYADGVIGATVDVLARALPRNAPPVRLELGTELMNSEVEFPERWEQLLARTRKKLAARGLTGRVLLSHDFAHHIMIPEDEVERMPREKRLALGRYIAGLDAVSVSQYMDLTVKAHHLPLPEPGEIADALAQHDRTLLKIFTEGLEIPRERVPPVHIGEFGVGSGGLTHPNIWEGTPEPGHERLLQQQIAQAMRGLAAYLRRGDRLMRTAVLWTTGRHFDIFGWMEPSHAIPEAAQAVREALRQGTQ